MNAFDRGLEIFRTKGWYKGGLVDKRVLGRSTGRGARCALGALSSETDEQLMSRSGPAFETTPELLLLAELILEQHPDWLAAQSAVQQKHMRISAREYPANLIYRFNDHKATEEDIFALFEKGSARMEEQL